MVSANVPSFRFSFRGGTCERTLITVCVPGEHPNVPSFRFSLRENIHQNHPLEIHPFVNPRKLIREGVTSLLGGWPGGPENVSFSRATPDLHRCNLGVALEQETFSGPWAILQKDYLILLPSPKRLLDPSPIDLGAIRAFGGCTRQSGSQR